MRLETAERLKVLEEQYWGKKDTQGVGQAMREKYKSYGSTAAESTIDTTVATSKKSKTSKNEGILKNSTKISGMSSESLAKPKFGQSKPSFGGDAGGRNRSKSVKKKSLSPEI